MSLTIKIGKDENSLEELNSLDALQAQIDSASKPTIIVVSNGAKSKQFTLMGEMYQMTTSEIGSGLVRRGALITFYPDQIIGQIKSEFNLNGGRRRRSRRRCSRRTRKYRK